ncbi:xanthine dehydrogenase accessory protein XdhC [Pararhizobium haloflavum]|uniref:xanthine dehydrogenase accessory protein XdhC n=1 Tax=Pararhizobium haloflavum TaxID=2037914 RepID=UPI000C185A37|nr:xanthine dehydrogenase accessory protein XdhC [Pararhizobium haloflavum]
MLIALESLVASADSVVLVEVTAAKGSTPRTAGTWMLVSATERAGTIGGGQLEFAAIDKARQMLRSGGEAMTLDIPLGPEIGQCCGGFVSLSLKRLDERSRDEVRRRLNAETAQRPHVYIFGAGHVGLALSTTMRLLPVRVILVDTRGDALADAEPGIETRLTPVPEAMVRKAPAGSAVVVMTHEHSLDFLITGEALSRGDLCYVGMIGSKTKKASFRSWFREDGGNEAAFAGLVCPIGGHKVRDKRPTIIAAMAAAEILERIFAEISAEASAGP